MKEKEWINFESDLIKAGYRKNEGKLALKNASFYYYKAFYNGGNHPEYQILYLIYDYSKLPYHFSEGFFYSVLAEYVSENQIDSRIDIDIKREMYDIGEMEHLFAALHQKINDEEGRI